MLTDYLKRSDPSRRLPQSIPLGKISLAVRSKTVRLSTVVRASMPKSTISIKSFDAVRRGRHMIPLPADEAAINTRLFRRGKKQANPVSNESARSKGRGSLAALIGRWNLPFRKSSDSSGPHSQSNVIAQRSIVAEHGAHKRRRGSPTKRDEFESAGHRTEAMEHPSSSS
jgi:hypothetical protein